MEGWRRRRDGYRTCSASSRCARAPDSGALRRSYANGAMFAEPWSVRHLYEQDTPGPHIPPPAGDNQPHRGPPSAGRFGRRSEAKGAVTGIHGPGGTVSRANRSSVASGAPHRRGSRRSVGSPTAPLLDRWPVAPPARGLEGLGDCRTGPAGPSRYGPAIFSPGDRRPRHPTAEDQTRTVGDGPTVPGVTPPGHSSTDRATAF